MGYPLTGGPVADFSRKLIYAIVEAVDKMLWMDGTSWAEFLLVAGGLKPMTCQWGVREIPDNEPHPRENPFVSKFSSIGEFEEYMTEAGVIFHVEESITDSDNEHRSYLISREREIIDQFLGRFDRAWDPELETPGEFIGKTGRLLGYPEDAIKANCDPRISDSERYLLSGFSEMGVSASIMRIRGFDLPKWINYVFHVPANGNLLGDFSESSMRQAKQYMAFIEENHPDFHEWYVDSNKIEDQHMKDIKCIVDWWDASQKG